MSNTPTRHHASNIIKSNIMKELNNFKQVAANWGWLKVLLLLWAVLWGIPFMFIDSPSTMMVVGVGAAALVLALAGTAFCIKCTLMYIKEVKASVDKKNKTEETTNNSNNN